MKSPQSRIHRLKSFDTHLCEAYIKREDELEYGSKTRKYYTLMPYLLAQEFKEIVLIGGANSNHILAMTQLLLENSLLPTLFLRKGFHSEGEGNEGWIRQGVDKHSIHWISRTEWLEVEKIAFKYAQERKNIFLIPEGGTLIEAFPGAMTLADDICRNEREEKKVFDHVFIDAGTGFTAIATLLRMAQQEKPSPHFHIVLLADEEKNFLTKLKQWHQTLFLDKSTHKHFEESFEYLKENHFTLYRPTNARSFGAVNRRLLNEIEKIQQEEKIHLDPIYSGKLFFEAKRLIKEKSLAGKILLIHSGLGVRFKQELLKR